MTGDRVPLDGAAVAELTRTTAAGGIVLFPAEGVYGLAADARLPAAATRMAGLKGRDPAKPSAVLFWALDDALAALEGAGERVLRATARLLPGPVGVLTPHGDGPYASAASPDGTLGVRVPLLDGPISAPPVIQTSANRAGGPDALTVDDVPASIRDGCDLVIDRGRRPGTPSTLVDLRGLSGDRPSWRIVRHGAVPDAAIASALDGLGRRVA